MRKTGRMAEKVPCLSNVSVENLLHYESMAMIARLEEGKRSRVIISHLTDRHEGNARGAKLYPGALKECTDGCSP